VQSREEIQLHPDQPNADANPSETDAMVQFALSPGAIACFAHEHSQSSKGDQRLRKQSFHSAPELGSSDRASWPQVDAVPDLLGADLTAPALLSAAFREPECRPRTRW
jgi:hypothetical protein